MKKKFKCEIDCANCAAKVEDAIKKVEGVKDASVNFLTQKFMLEADEDIYEEVLKKAIEAGKKAEDEFEVVL
ncbi:cation transporter [Lachnospira multipara]|jgi:copper chaperone CopZ|uniref:cation transporter n=1 Tax=Lachnospira multipara TaxID=28051 RepID=UPI00048492D3|nr:cation transporter [Lachnospira multipara]